MSGFFPHTEEILPWTGHKVWLVSYQNSQVSNSFDHFPLAFTVAPIRDWSLCCSFISSSGGSQVPYIITSAGHSSIHLTLLNSPVHCMPFLSIHRALAEVSETLLSIKRYDVEYFYLRSSKFKVERIELASNLRFCFISCSSETFENSQLGQKKCCFLPREKARSSWHAKD